MSEGHRGAGRRLASLGDPRILIGLAITAVTLWFALRGVSFATLARDIARANLAVLLIPSIPAYLATIYVRALRWRHLTLAVARIERGAVFRATSVGFMVNNVFPLRIGEVVRAWYLGRESGVSSAAIFGTVIVERLIDAAVVLSLAALVLGSRGAAATGLDLRAVLPPLAALVAVPVVFIVALRVAPEQTVALGTRISGPVLPRRWNATARAAPATVRRGDGRAPGQALGHVGDNPHGHAVARDLDRSLCRGTAGPGNRPGGSGPHTDGRLQPAHLGGCGRRAALCPWVLRALPRRLLGGAPAPGGNKEAAFETPSGWGAWRCPLPLDSSGPTTPPAGWRFSPWGCPRRRQSRSGPSATPSSGSR